MSKSSQEVNSMYNDIREAVKMEDGPERHNKIAATINRLSSFRAGAISASTDPAKSMSIYFGGFNAITMMIGSVDIDEDNVGSAMNYVQTVVGMCVQALESIEESMNGEA